MVGVEVDGSGFTPNGQIDLIVHTKHYPLTADLNGLITWEGGIPGLKCNAPLVLVCGAK